MNAVVRVRRAIQSRLFVDFSRDPADCVFLASAGRSGGTWLSEIINSRNEYRYIFEPFSPDHVRMCKAFKVRQYLRPDNSDRTFLDPATAILTGKIREHWVDKYNTKTLCRKRLIKDIRANLLLGWLYGHFPEVPIVFLLRHPCAVASSRMRLDWPDHTEDLLAQQDLVEDFLHPFVEDIRQAHDPFEKHIYQWCIENYVPLKQFSEGEICVIYYENLCEKPEAELHRLFTFLGSRPDEKALRVLRRPSPTIIATSAIISGTSLTGNWRKHVTEGQAGRAIEILARFGLDRIYSCESMPLVAAGGELAGIA